MLFVIGCALSTEDIGRRMDRAYCEWAAECDVEGGYPDVAACLEQGQMTSYLLESCAEPADGYGAAVDACLDGLKDEQESCGAGWNGPDACFCVCGAVYGCESYYEAP